MIIDNAVDFTRAVRDVACGPLSRPKAVLMVEPCGFRVSDETARDNVYMAAGQAVDEEKARRQHRDLAAAIAVIGLPAIRFTGRPETPDDIFPNNVFATCPGRLIVGAMHHAERRRESERPDIRAFFTGLLGYRTVELAAPGVVAELTGALVIDHCRNIGYCGMTERVNAAGAAAMDEAFGLDLTYCFPLKPAEYHTNVVMAVFAGRALVICPSAFADPADAAAIAGVYGERVLEIDEREKNAFAGNGIALGDNDVFFSATAARALGERKLQRLAAWGFTIHTVELDEIEKAGGSLRCCIAEIF